MINLPYLFIKLLWSFSAAFLFFSALLAAFISDRLRSDGYVNRSSPYISLGSVSLKLLSTKGQDQLEIFEEDGEEAKDLYEFSLPPKNEWKHYFYRLFSPSLHVPHSLKIQNPIPHWYTRVLSNPYIPERASVIAIGSKLANLALWGALFTVLWFLSRRSCRCM